MAEQRTTAHGDQVMTTMADERQRAAADLVADLSPAELEQFGRTLDTVTGRLRQLVEAAADTGVDPGPVAEASS